MFAIIFHRSSFAPFFYVNRVACVENKQYRNQSKYGIKSKNGKKNFTQILHNAIGCACEAHTSHIYHCTCRAAPFLFASSATNERISTCFFFCHQSSALYWILIQVTLHRESDLGPTQKLLVTNNIHRLIWTTDTCTERMCLVSILTYYGIIIVNRFDVMPNPLQNVKGTDSHFDCNA